MRAVFDLDTEVWSLKVACDCQAGFCILWRNVFSLLGHLFSSAHGLSGNILTSHPINLYKMIYKILSL